MADLQRQQARKKRGSIRYQRLGKQVAKVHERIGNLCREFRVHVCPHCGHTAQRDQNAASVVLIDAHTPGTGVAARPKPLARQRAKSKSMTRETPATASTDA
jgi:transposase